jgi:hemerythrin-like domain-containing protein
MLERGTPSAEEIAMTPPDQQNPRILLLEDHKRIDALLDRLLAAVRADDREASQTLWKQCEESLLKHFDVEEMFVFPAIREGHSAEVDGLRREHDTMRRRLGELGLALELHTLRCDAIESLCTALREHAEREDSLAYVQAGRTLSIGVARSIAARIKASVGARARSRAAAARSAP